MSGDQEDSESIAFVGSIEGESESLDFNQPLWLVEIEYPYRVTQHVVNALSGKEALAEALNKARGEGENVVLSIRIEVAQLETLVTEGESDES